jgi:hypothetical protein
VRALDFFQFPKQLGIIFALKNNFAVEINTRNLSEVQESIEKQESIKKQESKEKQESIENAFST